MYFPAVWLLLATFPKAVKGGVLTVGAPITWNMALPYLKYVRQHGVLQFISRYDKMKEIVDDELRWGDEIEYSVVVLDHEHRRPRMSLRAADLLASLEAKESEKTVEGCNWMPEYGAWMIEGTPRKPYMGYSTDLLRVESNMRLRRARLLAGLQPNEIIPTMSVFPCLGASDDFCAPPAKANGPVAASTAIPDACINPHPRFAALTQNIRARRGAKVDIHIPLHRDVATPEFKDESQSAFIEMDAMAFGMGCCCQQVTFQARDVDESRYMFDQLTVISPIFLALSASSPIMKGRLAATDARWNTISASVDDRTPAERGHEPVGTGDERMAGAGVTPLHKSRYDSVSGYIYDCASASSAGIVDKYNDISRELDAWSLETLRAAGVDELLAKHVAHLFVRDPLVIFEGRIEEIEDALESDHWDNLQSTNWQTVRWKPPPARSPDDATSSHIGWRVEFRPMELQLTDFENAAYAVFVVLVTRVILAFDLNLYIPISKVDENMARAHAQDAILTEKFFFRKNIAPPQERQPFSPFGDCVYGNVVDSDDEYEEMTIQEILCGKDTYYPGLIVLVNTYLEHIGCPEPVVRKVEDYLDLIRKRASGEVLTTAAWIRQFVMKHPEYENDSVVSDHISYDLLKACAEIGQGEREAPELIGRGRKIAPLSAADANYDVALSSTKIDSKITRDLIESYMKRKSRRQNVDERQSQA